MFVRRFLEKASRKPSSGDNIAQGLGPEDVQPRVVFHNGIPSGSTCLAYDRVQRILAVSTKFGQIKLFGSCNSQALLESEKATPSKFLQFVENRGVLLNVTIENHIEVWDIAAKRPSHVHLFTEEITSISVLQQKCFVFVGDCIGNVSILKVNVETRKLECMQYRIPFSESHGATTDANYSCAVTSILPHLMAESRRLLIIFKDGAICLWGIQESKLMFLTGGTSSTSWHSETRKVTSACWGCPYGSKVVVGYSNGEIYIWSIPKLSEIRMSTTSDRTSFSTSHTTPFLKLNLTYKVNKVPVVNLGWKFADGRAPRIYINGTSDTGSSSLQVVVLNENTELRTVKLVLPLPDACLGMEVIFSFDEWNRQSEILLVLLKSGQFCVYSDSDIENYLLHSQLKSFLQHPKQLAIKIPFLNSRITAAKLVLGRLNVSAKSSEEKNYLVSRIPSLFSTDPRDEHAQLFTRFSAVTETCNLYITGHQDGLISFWDASWGLLLPVLSLKHQEEDCQLSNSPVNSLCFDISSQILISGHKNGLVTIYEFKVPQSITNSIFTCLQAKQGYNYAASSVKLNGAIQTICLDPEHKSFAVGTDGGYVYAIKIEGMVILYQKQFTSGLPPCIVHLQFYNHVVDNSEKNVLLVGLGDSSVLALEGGTGNMVGSNIVQCKNPKNAVLLQILDTKYTLSHQPLLLHCSEKSARIYSLPHVIQGIKKVYTKKNLHGRCCWATTFCSPSGCGLVLLFASGKMETRSLPELSLLKETQLRGLTCSELRVGSKLNDVLCSSSNGNLVLARGDQEVLFYSILKKDPNTYTPQALRLRGYTDQVYMNDVADPQRHLHPANKHREKKLGIFSTLMKEVKESKAKEEQEDIDSGFTAEQLSDLFSTCNFPLISQKSDRLTSDERDIELDIDDIDIDDSEEKSKGKNIAILSKQLGNKFNVLKGKLKTKALKNLEISSKERNIDEKPVETVCEIKKRYGYFTAGETSVPKLAQSKLAENLSKLQGISIRTSDMQNMARSFSSAAKELLQTVEQKK